MMKIKIYMLLVGLSLAAFISCGGNSPTSAKSEITVKYDGQEKTFEPKSSLIDHNTLTMNKDETAWRTQIYLANYEIDTSKGSFSVEQAIKSPDQIRVMIMLYGEKGTDEKTPAKVGEYINKPATDVFDKVANVTVHYFKDGKEIPKLLNMSNNWQAKVNITSVTEENISGTIDATGGDFAVKGSFTAKKK